jgi:hypothetical protein
MEITENIIVNANEIRTLWLIFGISIGALFMHVYTNYKNQ